MEIERLSVNVQSLVEERLVLFALDAAHSSEEAAGEEPPEELDDHESDKGGDEDDQILVDEVDDLSLAGDCVGAVRHARVIIDGRPAAALEGLLDLGLASIVGLVPRVLKGGVEGVVGVVVEELNGSVQSESELSKNENGSQEEIESKRTTALFASAPDTESTEENNSESDEDESNRSKVEGLRARRTQVIVVDFNLGVDTSRDGSNTNGHDNKVAHHNEHLHAAIRSRSSHV